MVRSLAQFLLLLSAGLLVACGGNTDREPEQPPADGALVHQGAKAPRLRPEAIERRELRRSTPVPAGRWRPLPRVAGVAREGPDNLRAVTAWGRAIIIAGQAWPRKVDPRAFTEAQEAMSGIAFTADGSGGRLLPQAPVARPEPHTRYSAVSDGQTVYTWGGGGARIGDSEADSLATGAAYDTRSQRWRRVSTAPFGSQGHTAIWSSGEMIVWGGVVHSEFRRRLQLDQETSRGAAYDPESDSWRSIAEGPLTPRSGATAIWSGVEMIVWGGSRSAKERAARPERFTDGAAYNPETDTWRSIAQAPLGGPKRGPFGPQSVWTGRRMIVWDGTDGAVYAPEVDRWRRIAPAPFRARFGFSAVWTGERMIIWKNGLPTENPRPFADGAAYDPRRNRWQLLPKPRFEMPHQSVALWTGDALLVWGDRGISKPAYAGAVYLERG